MGIWAWVQPVDRINGKVISDDEKGTLYVYNEKSETCHGTQRDEQRRALFIEDNFLQNCSYQSLRK